jgi:hypothetical protein
MSSIAIWPILAAGALSVIIGFIWYHPRVFGTVWMRLAGITPEMAERGKRRMPVYIIIAFLSATLAAWVMNTIGVALGIHDWKGAIFNLALWAWLGFVVPAMLGSVLWEHRPLSLYLINALYWLVTLCAIALILLF